VGSGYTIGAESLRADASGEGIDISALAASHSTAGAWLAAVTGTSGFGSDTAWASTGLTAPSLSFIGTSDAIAHNGAANPIQYDPQADSGVETIANAGQGLGQLDIGLPTAASSVLDAETTSAGAANPIFMDGGTHAFAVGSLDPRMGGAY
jgi:hypothetical protein